MSWTLTLAAPFEHESLVVSARMPDDSTAVLLVADGKWTGDLAARPVALRIVTNDDGLAGAAHTVPADAGATVATTVEALTAHDIALPPVDHVRLALAWSKQCHTGGPKRPDERFGSREHVHCADALGEIDGLGLLPTTLIPIGKATLTFGQIIALAGDFYAHYDDDAFVHFADAWPPTSSVTDELVGGDYRLTTLHDDDPQRVVALATAIEKSTDAATLGDEVTKFLGDEHPTKRYLALASQNFCHFGHPRDARNEALRLYQRYHARALDIARKAPYAHLGDETFCEALRVDAFGCHFLTDLFAAGHMRVPRRALVARLGVLLGGLIYSKKMHDEDNGLGLWCIPRAARGTADGVVWRAYGDGFLEAPAARAHKARVERAVNASVRELVAAASRAPSPPFAECAEGMIPVALPPGADPYANGAQVITDDVPYEQLGPNHHPLYCPADRDGAERAFVRLGDGASTRYRLVMSPLSPAVAYDTLA